MDKFELYNTLAERKSCPQHYEPYRGGNGRIDKAVRLFKNGILKTGGTLLDVGGSIGDLGYALRDKFERRITLDISEKVLDAARSKGNETFVSDVDKVGFTFFENCSINSIVALDFIEHVIDPQLFVRECFRILKPGGQVFCNTPNIQFFKYLESQVFHGIFPHTSGDREVYWGGHLAYYEYRSLNDIFTQSGFINCEQIKDEEGFESPPILWQELYQRGQKLKSKEDYLTMNLRLGCPNLLFKCEKG